MKILGSALVLLGLAILVWPDIINYVIALILIVSGINMLVLGGVLGFWNRGNMPFGDYELIKRKK